MRRPGKREDNDLIIKEARKMTQTQQIKDLEKRLAESSNDLYNLMHTIREMDYAKQDNDTGRYDYWNKRLGQIVHIKPYGKVKDIR